MTAMLPDQRPDQEFNPPGAAVVPGPRSVFRGTLVVIFGTGPNKGLFVYSPVPGAGNLIGSIAAAAGTDPYGNAYQAGFTSYFPAVTAFGQLFNAGLNLSISGAFTANGQVVANQQGVTFAAPWLELLAPQQAGSLDQAVLTLLGGNTGGTRHGQALLTLLKTALPGTTALLEVQGSARATDLGDGLQDPLTNGGTITAATITSAQTAGYSGLKLNPLYGWDASGLVINNVKNFRIRQNAWGSIGFNGQVQVPANVITTSTGAPADGIQIFASTPGGSPTQGILLEDCVIVGANSNAVVHLGGGQRRCGFRNALIQNTSAAVGAYAVINDTALSNNNGEDNIFSFLGGGGLAGAYAALGIGIADQTQHVNDTWYYGLATHGGVYSIVHNAGGNHTFVEWYDRSNPTTATVWNHGGGRLTFHGGEFQNTTGLSILQDGTGQTILYNTAVTQAGAATTCQVSAGSLIFRGACTFNGAQTIALSGTGVVDLSDPAINASAVTITGSAGTVLVAANYAGQGAPPILSSFTGTVVVVAMTVDVEQPFSFANSWAAAAGRQTNQYFLASQPGAAKDSVLVMGSVVIPAGFAGGQAITNAAAAAYRPVNGTSLYGIDITASTMVRLFWTSGGVLQWQGTLGAAVAAADTVDIPPQLVYLKN